MIAHRRTDILFAATAAVFLAAMGWHYASRVRATGGAGRSAFIAQLFDDSALRRRRWRIVAPESFVFGALRDVGSLTVVASATAPDVRRLDIELDVPGLVSARSFQRWHRRDGVLELSGTGEIFGRPFDFTASREGDLVEVKIIFDGAPMPGRLLEANDVFTGFSPFLPMRNLRVGDSWTVATVNPLSREVNRDKIVVEREEVIEHGGVQVTALVAVSQGREGVQAWYGPDGEVLRADLRAAMVRMRLELEPRSAGAPGAEKEREGHETPRERDSS